MNSLCH